MQRLALGLCWLGVPGLAVLAASFLFFPEIGLELTSHRRESLVAVVGDRYLVMALYLLAALLYSDKRVLSGVLVGFAIMGLSDAVIYAAQGPWAHLAAAVVCGFGAWAVWPRMQARGARDDAAQ